MVRLFSSFGYAIEGLKHTARYHPNFKIHLVFALIAIILGFVLKISSIEFLVLLFGITFVLVAEMLNTGIEEITNLVTTEHRKEAKIAKDVGAAMVLLAVAFSVVMGLVIFLPKIF